MTDAGAPTIPSAHVERQPLYRRSFHKDGGAICSAARCGHKGPLVWNRRLFRPKAFTCGHEVDVDAGSAPVRLKSRRWIDDLAIAPLLPLDLPDGARRGAGGNGAFRSRRPHAEGEGHPCGGHSAHRPGAQPLARRPDLHRRGSARRPVRPLPPGRRLPAGRHQSAAGELVLQGRDLDPKGPGRAEDHRAEGRAAGGGLPGAADRGRLRHAHGRGARPAGRLRARVPGPQPGLP